jgi:PAS domain-containing protein
MAPMPSGNGGRQCVGTGTREYRVRLRLPEGDGAGQMSAPHLCLMLKEMFGLNIDNDDRKHAEALLRQSEQRYRELFGSMDEAYAVVEVLKGNDGAGRTFASLAYYSTNLIRRSADHRHSELRKLVLSAGANNRKRGITGGLMFNRVLLSSSGRWTLGRLRLVL